MIYIPNDEKQITSPVDYNYFSFTKFRPTNYELIKEPKAFEPRKNDKKRF